MEAFKILLAIEKDFIKIYYNLHYNIFVDIFKVNYQTLKVHSMRNIIYTGPLSSFLYANIKGLCNFNYCTHYTTFYSTLAWKRIYEWSFGQNTVYV